MAGPDRTTTFRAVTMVPYNKRMQRACQVSRIAKRKMRAPLQGTPAVIAGAPNDVQDDCVVRINWFSRTSTLMFWPMRKLACSSHWPLRRTNGT